MIPISIEIVCLLTGFMMIDNTDTIDIKIAALHCHKSQVGDGPRAAEWMRQWAKSSAEGQDYELGEAFHREEIRW